MSAAPEYPPPHHLLRDLNLEVERPDPDELVVWMPVTPAVGARSGRVAAGAVATLVDVVGGGLAVTAARPGWIATADLAVHLVDRPFTGEVEARGRLLRAGRSTVVLEVLLASRTAPVGIATMTFAVLPHRDTNPTVDEVETIARSPFLGPADDGPSSVVRQLGLRTPAPGVAELDLTPYSCNSLGALQGGVLAWLVDAAATGALSAECGAQVETVDLQISYLHLGRVGPFTTTTRVLATAPTGGRAVVEVRDRGDGDRLLTVGRAGAAMAAAR